VGQLYVVNSPDLVYACFRNRNLSFDPFVSDFIKKAGNVSDATMKVFDSPSFHSQYYQAITSSLQGVPLQRTNLAAMKVILEQLQDITAEGIKVDNLYDWAWRTFAMGSMVALFGRDNPWREDPSLADAFW
jgi:hypothetical protein